MGIVTASIDTECQDFGFDYGISKWECNDEWFYDEGFGGYVNGTCNRAYYELRGADGIVVKAGSTIHYSLETENGTIEQCCPELSHITFCGNENGNNHNDIPELSIIGSLIILTIIGIYLYKKRK
jgi:hypothetical protein